MGKMLAALNKTIELSGKSHKELYLELNIDPGQWARILKGDANFPLTKLKKLFDLCGNKVLLEKIADECDCVLLTKREFENMELRYKHVIEFVKDTQK
jgi:hypothetical protein